MTKKNKNKKKEKQKVTLQYAEMEDGEIISDSSESGNASNEVATPPADINEDLEATQNTSSCAVNKKQGSQNSSETNAEAEETTTAAAAKTTDIHRAEQPKRGPTLPAHPLLTNDDIIKESIVKKTKLYIGNISTDTTAEDIRELFGLNTTADLRENTNVQVFLNSKSQFKGYAIVEIYQRHAQELLKLDGFEYKSRKLVIQLARNPPKSDKSIAPYNRRGTQREKGHHGNPDTSSENNNNAVRPAPTSSSRQEESHTESDFWEQSLEAVRGRDEQKQNNETMAEQIQRKHKHQELEQRKRRQLLFEVDCNQRDIPERALPDASLVYTALTKQMGLTKDSSNHQVQAIYQPDPNNFWRWAVMFSEESVKDKFEGKQAELRWTDDNDKTYTYSVRTTGAPRGLLVTLYSSPLIDDDELRDEFRSWGVVKSISHRGHAFAPHIDSGLRRVFLHLHQNVKPEDIPGYVTLSDGVPRKLFFRGKRYVCAKCSARHTYLEGCAEGLSQENAEEPNNDNTQETTTQKQQTKTNKHPQTENSVTANKQQKPDNTTSGRNRTNTINRTDHMNKTSNLSTHKDKDEKGEEDFNISGVLSASQQGDFPLSPCMLTTIIPETQIDREGNKKATPAAKPNAKPMEKNRRKTGSQSRMTKMIDPLPLCQPPMKFR